MDKLEQVYLIFSFPDDNSLVQAARSLAMPEGHLAILGREGSRGGELANSLGVRNELKDEIPLDAGLRERLDWHLDQGHGPLLAVEVMAAQGRDLRLRLEEFGARDISSPEIWSQEPDVDYDPGQSSSDEPDLPPHKGRINAPN